jgi:two-component system, cell cycle sensor histidine kinase and response regulator CckA
MAPGEARVREHSRLPLPRSRNSEDTDPGAADGAPSKPDAALSHRCAVLAAELSLLSGVADALTRRADPDGTIRHLLAATLDAASISKGALVLRGSNGILELRHHIGFSESERLELEELFREPFLEEIVERGGSAALPSSSVPASTTSAILDGANLASLHIVPLKSDGRGIGAMIIGSTHSNVTSDDSLAFVRAIGNQIVQSLALTRSVASLRASEERYRTLLESASDAIAVLTLDGIVREVNHRWEELTGLPRAQLIGRHARDLAPGRTGIESTRTFEGAVTGPANRTMPVEIAGPAGTWVLVDVTSTIVEVGGESLMLTISHDVTEHRRLEDQLHHAQKLEGIGQLAGGIAHDFNNLLTIILGFAELAMTELQAEDPAHADLVEIAQASERAAALTRQLLAFSRKQVLEPKILDLNAVVIGMEPLLRRLIFENIDLTVALPPDVDPVYMDPSQIERVLVNLVINATDAMPRGGRLTLQTANFIVDERYQRGHLPVAAGAYVMLGVSDTGVGMDATTSTRIFEPFFTTKGPDKGTGLGLATVYGIVKQSGGDVWVYSEPGLGTTFKIYLPRAPAGVQPATSLSNTPVVEVPLGVETILLVEDDKDVRGLARTRLERSGYRVLEAADPREAGELASTFAGEIHLLLSDVIMPHSEGEPLIDRLDAVRPGLKVLYISGYADEAVVRRGVLREGMPFLQKPFTPGTLARKVREVLDAPRLW